jgi:hypothetical protein
VPAKFWLTREAQYREALGRLDECRHLNEWVDWLKELPLTVMRKRGLISNTRDKAAQVLESLKFFGVASPDAWRAIWEQEAVAFRTTIPAADRLGGMATWLRLGELEAQEIDCAPFDAKQFRSALAQLRGLTAQTPNTFMPVVRHLCAEAGVVVALIQEIPGTASTAQRAG